MTNYKQYRFNSSDLLNRYDDSLNKNGTVLVGNVYGNVYKFYPSEILSAMEPESYRSGFYDFLNNENIDLDIVYFDVGV